MSLDEKNLYPIGGQGGSGGGSTPSEDPDTLQSHTFVSILDLLGEGQIGGLVGTNTVEKEKSIYIDGTPMRTNGGTENFKGVSWAERTGTQDQSYIDGYGSIETPTSVNVQLKFNVPKVISITNSRVDEVRIILAIGGLMVTESDGDIRGSSVNFSIGMATNSGSSSEVAARTIKGKASSRYQVAYTVKLPKVANDGTPITRWDIQVTRTTPDSTEAGTQNDLYFDSYSEVITKKLTYPNSALVATRVNSEHFSSMPKREYLVDGLLIKVPSNYNHVTREYTGIWDGSFKLASSNNPAWIMFDILTNNRYGLGEYIDAGLVDEARLYQIGRYCDQMVDDGFGNMEPRYTINCTINSRAEAYDLIADICSAFNGMSYWAGGQVGFTIDAPSDPVMAFTSANIEGEFGYSGTSVKDRHSIAVVTWNDPKDDYKQAVEYVEDPDLIERYGVRKIEIQAFGCTSRAQAHRYGRWILYTEHQQSEVCSFTAGMDASTLMPGSIVQIQDEHRAGKRFGGRLLSCTATSAILDDDIDFTGFETGLKFAVMLSDGSFVEREIATKTTRTTVIGTTDKTHTATEVTWVTPLEKLPVSQAVWVISAPNLELVQARVVGVKQGVDLDKFEISVIPHNPNKYAAIEKNVMLEIPPTSILSSRNQVPPSEVRIKQEVLVHQGLSKTRLVIDWERADKAIRYSVEWKRDEDNWVRLPETANLSAEVEDVYTGTYIARVTAIGMSGARSYPQYSVSADLTGKSGNLALPVAFEAHGILFGMEMSWEYPANSKDSSHVVIEVSDTNNVADAKLLAAVPYPATTHTVTGLMGNLTQYYRIKLVDKSGNESEFTPFVSAKTLEDPEILIEMLSGHVDKIVLSPEVVDQIEQATVDNAQNRADLLAETAARIAELQATQNDLVAEADARIAGDAAEAAARVNAIKAEETARNAAINAKVAEINSNIATQIDAVQDGIDQEVIDRTDAVNTVRGELNTYKTSNDSAVATALQKVDAVTTAHDATVTELDALQSSFEGLSGDLSAATTDLSSFKQTVANADAALGTRIDNLTTTVNNNNTAVNGRIANVETSVTTLEGNVNTKTSQLQSSLDTTNTNVTAAANAANAANTLAGGKGKVLYQSTAPSTEDRLSQNLWIDTTGNANTPKRWNGTAWVAVTDKIATDALAAANAAVATVATKADASAVDTLTTRVSTAEGTITSQGTRVTNLENSVNHAATGLSTKASTTALNTLDGKVTTIDGKTTANTNDITSLSGRVNTVEGAVATKADASALNNIYTKTQTDAKATEIAAGKVDEFKASLKVGGTNLLAKSKMTNGYVDAFTGADGTNTTHLRFKTPEILGTHRTVVFSTSNPEINLNVYPFVGTTYKGRITLTQGVPYTFNSDVTSFKVEGGDGTRGNLENISNYKMQLEYGTIPTDWSPAPEDIATTESLSALDSKVTNIDGKVTANSASITNISGKVTAVENGLATKADASALNSLTTRVGNTEGALSTQSNSITSLQNSLSNLSVGGTNLKRNSDFATGDYSGWPTNGGVVSVLSGDSKFNTFAKISGTDGNGFFFYPIKGWEVNTTYTASFYIRNATKKLHVGIEDGNAWVAKSDYTVGSTEWERVVVTFNKISTWGAFIIYLNAGSDTHSYEITRVMLEKGSVVSEWSPAPEDIDQQLSANATAISTLDNKVTSIDGRVTTNSSNITSLQGKVTVVENGLATKADGSALSSLATRVSNAEGELSSQSSKVTKLEASVGNTFAHIIATYRNGNYRSGGIDAGVYTPKLVKAGGFYRGMNLVVWAADGTLGSISTFDTYATPTAIADLATAVLALPTNTYFTLVGVDNVGSSSAFQSNADLKNFVVANGGSSDYYSTWGDTSLPIFTSMVGTGSATGIQHSFNSNVSNDWVKYPITFIGGIPEGMSGTQPIDESKFATASALSTLDSKVTSIDGRVTSNAGSITNLQAGLTAANNSISTKADSSALSALTARVDGTESGIQASNENITSLQSKLDNVSVGGTNLLSNTKDVGNIGTYLGFGYKRSTRPAGSTQYVDPLGYFVNNLSAGTYVLSFYARANKVQSVNNFFYAPDNTQSAESSTGDKSNAGNGRVITILTTEWKRYWVRWTIPSDTESKGLVVARLDDYDSSERWVEIAAPKIEKGTLATDWSPSSSDVQSQLDANAAATDTLNTTVSNLNGTVTSQATSIANLSTTVGNQTTSISTLTTSVNGINASHTVKINNNGYSSGFGLISTGSYGETTSAFKVDADFFEVGKSGTGIKPFIIVTSANQIIEGVTYPSAGTYINSAKIANATIKLAHIDTASITSLRALSAELGTFTSTGADGGQTIISGSLFQVTYPNGQVAVRLGRW